MKTQATLVVLAAAWALGSGAGFAKERLPAVAYVSLVVGQVSLVRSNGEALPVQRGLNLHESDRLVTGEDGMVMVVFVDEGRVALRSGSELLIRKYKYDTVGADSDLQLELLKGTMRQISGKAAKRQPERYHLNTPVAAIGVRGTDFLAKADNTAVRTYVHEGAITVQSRLAPQEPVLSKAGEGRYLMAYGEGHLEQHALKLAELEQSFSIQLAPSAGGGRGSCQESDTHLSR
ncbi:FecR domain-containing protein [Comamonas sp. w2-DMI]|uniref:FecR family protein n=1 Tax=Comamonas sp. w2-DMI TaxID=3126391 RepID=UPI0032E52671